MRRKEFGATLKKGVYDAMVYYDFQADTWLDVFVRFESKAFFGRDVGRFRFGYMKTPVGLDANTSSRAGSFLETSLPVQAFYEGRRTGVEWVLERPQYLLQAGAYGGRTCRATTPEPPRRCGRCGRRLRHRVTLSTWAWPTRRRTHAATATAATCTTRPAPACARARKPA